MKLTRRSLLAALPAWAAGPRPRIRGLATRRHTINNRDYLFVEVETSDGITGLAKPPFPAASTSWKKPCAGSCRT